MPTEKLIKTPEAMWELFTQYVEEIKGNPRKEHDFVGKDATEVHRKKEKPLTLVGFYNYCRRNASEVHHYFEDTDKRYAGYRGICRAIKEEVRQDQIEGGMTNQYNPSITQRLNNLTEKSEVKQDINFDNLPEWLRPNKS